MSGLQRYVSDELTHFVGRGLGEEEQYRILTEVLRTGILTPDGADVEGHVRVDRDARLSDNLAYDPEAVCLCDIPVGDLDLHIRKYSPFGLSFSKPFLVERGANPVYYVAAESRTWAPDNGRVHERTRADYFDAMTREHHALRDLAQTLATRGDAETARFAERYLAFAHFLDFEVFSYTKFFAFPAPEDAPENYYMEREWRLLAPVRFEMEDVRRVILPAAYAQRFREAFPGYAGQVTFGSHGRG